MTDIIGWIGNIFFVLGAIAIAYKYRIGFILNGFANVLYVVVGILVPIVSLTVLSLILAIINLVGFLKWKRKI